MFTQRVPVLNLHFSQQHHTAIFAQKINRILRLQVGAHTLSPLSCCAVEAGKANDGMKRRRTCMSNDGSLWRKGNYCSEEECADAELESGVMRR